MGSSLSNLTESSNVGTPGLGDIPENCVARVFLHLTPPEICNLARLNRAFRGAASSDSVGKGRDVGLNQIALFEGKVAGGNGEQVLSRDIYRLGQLFDFFRMLSFYFTTVGFYFCTMDLSRSRLGGEATPYPFVFLEGHGRNFFPDEMQKESLEEIIGKLMEVNPTTAPQLFGSRGLFPMPIALAEGLR